MAHHRFTRRCIRPPIADPILPAGAAVGDHARSRQRRLRRPRHDDGAAAGIPVPTLQALRSGCRFLLHRRHLGAGPTAAIGGRGIYKVTTSAGGVSTMAAARCSRVQCQRRRSAPAADHRASFAFSIMAATVALAAACAKPRLTAATAIRSPAYSGARWPASRHSCVEVGAPPSRSACCHRRFDKLDLRRHHGDLLRHSESDEGRAVFRARPVLAAQFGHVCAVAAASRSRAQLRRHLAGAQVRRSITFYSERLLADVRDFAALNGARLRAAHACIVAATMRSR